MNRKRNLWIFIGVVVLAAALVSGFVLMQTSAEDMLVQTLETGKTITDGHAVVAIDVDTIEQDASGTVEVWAMLNEDGDEHQIDDTGESGDSTQDFSAVFEPVADDAELRAFEKIEENQESLEHELGDSFVDGSGQSKDRADTEDLPAVIGDEDKVEVRGLSSLLSNIIKKEVKALKDLFRTELRALRDKLKDKE